MTLCQGPSLLCLDSTASDPSCNVNREKNLLNNWCGGLIVQTSPPYCIIQHLNVLEMIIGSIADFSLILADRFAPVEGISIQNDHPLCSSKSSPLWANRVLVNSKLESRIVRITVILVSRMVEKESPPFQSGEKVNERRKKFLARIRTRGLELRPFAYKQKVLTPQPTGPPVHKWDFGNCLLILPDTLSNF